MLPPLKISFLKSRKLARTVISYSLSDFDKGAHSHSAMFYLLADGWQYSCIYNILLNCSRRILLLSLHYTWIYKENQYPFLHKKFHPEVYWMSSASETANHLLQNKNRYEQPLHTMTTKGFFSEEV